MLTALEAIFLLAHGQYLKQLSGDELEKKLALTL
jgi:hypothetical protein